VLGDRAARTGGDQRGGRRDVEGAAPATGARRVEQVAALDPDRRRQRAHRAREALDLLLRLPLGAQRDEERRDLRVARVAGHDHAEDLGRLVGRQGATRGERLDRAGQDVVWH